VYSDDLAYVHDTAFGDLARQAAPAIVEILRARGLRRGPVIEVGCGSGIAAHYLVRCGYDVTGFDVSRAMIRLARARVPAARFRVSSIERLQPPPCAAAIAIGEVVSYVTGGIAALDRFFARLHGALRPGGAFIFDFIESADRRTFATKSFGGAGWALASRATFDAATRVLTRRILVLRTSGNRVRHADETHHLRIYSRAEMTDALRRAGFTARMSRSYGRCRLLPGDLAVVATRR
jgi:SAM-dependent methyltransferase